MRDTAAGIFALTVLAAPLAAQDFTLRLDDWVQMPASGDLTLTGASLGANPNYFTRINFMREEPGGTDRMWVCDLNGNIYIFDKTGNYTTRTSQLLAQAQANESTATGGVYLDFNRSNLGVSNTSERLNIPNNPSGFVTGTHRATANNGLFVHFTKQAGFANGLVTFQFDPDYVNNGKFYTVHIEMVNTSTGNSSAGNRTSGSALITGISTSNKVVGQLVSGTGIPAGAWIAAIGSSNITLSAPATSTGSSTYTFADPHKPNNSKFPNFDTTGYTSTTAVNPPAGSVTRHAVLIEWTDTNINNDTFEGTARELLRLGYNDRIHPLGDIIFNPLATDSGHPEWRVMYLANGDGGAGEANNNNRFTPQRLDSLNGKILRIIPDLSLHSGASTLSANGRYRIPDDNPFIELSNTTNATIRKEIWSYGHRNPHRMMWDAVSNKLLVQEIGLHEWEEVNIIEPGVNYGYSEREGTHKLDVTAGQAVTPIPSPDTIPIRVSNTTTIGNVTPTYPVIEYPHSPEGGDAISSGFVYRGSAIPALQGKFIFGDITTGRLWWADYDAMLTVHDGDNTATTPFSDVKIQWDSPYDGAGVQTYSRMFEIVTAAYHARGGTDGDLPGGATISGTGRADIRLLMDSQGELYILSKSDGMIRALSAIPTPVISTHPGNQTALVGESKSFTATATSSPAASFQWQRAPADGGAFADLANDGIYSGVTTGNLTVSNITATMNGDQFRCVAGNDGGSATTSAATLTVNFSPQVTVQPGNQTVEAGQTATFTVAGTGNPAPSYQWQFSGDGGLTFQNLPANAFFSNVTTETLTIQNTTVSMTNLQVRCVLTNGIDSSVASDAATLTVSPADPYAAWAAGVFTPEQLSDPAVSGETADPDHDGLTNLLEYAFDLGPLDGASAQLPQPTATSTTVTLVFTALRADLIYTVEASTDLSTWSLDDVTIDTVGNQVTATVPVPLGAKVFLHIVVSKPSSG